MRNKLTFSIGCVALLLSFWLYAGNDFRAVVCLEFKELHQLITEKITVTGREEGAATRSSTETNRQAKTALLADCLPVNLPFLESFETTSTTVNCWTVLDRNTDGLPNSNKWLLNNASSFAYKGLYSYSFVSTATATNHDDWLISPEMILDGNRIYKLTYYYRTNGNFDNEIAVLLSTNGTNVSDFTTVLQKKAVYKNGSYKKKTIYITQANGNTNIAWHITSKGATNVYIDQVSLEQVGCIGPNEEVLISEVETDQATFEWTDKVNSQWEYFVKDAGTGPPNGSGTLTNTSKITVNKLTGLTTNLQPNSEYEFYVRSTCGVGKMSQWIGPVSFKTNCTEFTAPFWEGFNTNSPTFKCWSIVDHNADSATPPLSNIWQQYGFGQFEGDRNMYFVSISSATAQIPHDDWLISPTFKLDPKKHYRLKYHYKTTTSDFRLLLSTTGTDRSDFKRVLLEKKAHTMSNWKEEVVIIGNISGAVNFAWNINSENIATTMYVDNVFLEEVVGCPEPTILDTKDEKDNSVTVTWVDDFGKDWEYVVQDKGVPAPLGSGILTTNREVIVTQDKNGTKLKGNTEYEFYIRTRCSDGSYSAWIGPFIFRTTCGILATNPFFEHFNADSKTLNCWTLLDENRDSTSPTGFNIWRPFAAVDFVGSQAMRFFGEATKSHDDWLISPTFKFKPSKKYRFKYKYKTDSNSEVDFEVLASNNGIKPADFKVEIVKKATYKLGNYEEHKSFITGLSGDVNIAWRTSGAGFKIVFIDDVFVEEVETCPEPLILDVKEEGKKQATILWTDDFGATKWEYYVQEIGGGQPQGKGTSTTTKENIIAKVQTGALLNPNTDYEFYVRTDCGDGTFSIWAGPFAFATLCDWYSTPLWEGFNTNSKTARCWVTVDQNKDGNGTNGSWSLLNTNQYEGNRGMGFTGSSNNDDWLISPTIVMDGGMYVLKYHYKANAEFEVLLSTNGMDTKEFTEAVVSKKTYNNNGYIEEVVFINGYKGDVNLAWHVLSKVPSSLYVDNIYLKKVSNCPEPYSVKLTNPGTTSVDVEWKQDGGISDWEVIVVEYGNDETATPIATVNTSGTPKTKITGLVSGKGYTIYIRVKCLDGKSYSDWSTPVNFGTLVDLNNNCSGALSIPVNNVDTCDKIISAAFMNAAASSIAEPSCGSVALKNDIWFTFTATKKTHILEIKNWLNLIDATVPVFFGALYDQPCSTINSNAVECFNLSATVSKKLFKNLIPGQTYHIRLATTVANLKGIFNLCLTSPNYLEISPSGDKYTVEQLITEVLVNSECNLISNVTHQNGDGGPKAMAYNTVGYFNKGKTDFPFEEGIILSTNEIEYAAGPAQSSSRDFRGANAERWVGDKDVNSAIQAAGGAPFGVPNKRVTQLEFDFIPIADSLQFEYLFASNSYYADCNSLGCNAGALFAAWLVDETTGEGQNLARINGTELPIALNTILNPIKTGKIQCPSSHPDLYWKHYTPNQDNPFEAYIDFVGLTRVMKSDRVTVVPGRKYHIKLAVIDFCTIVSHSSAVLFNAGSFSLGKLDLGKDLTIADKTALCAGQEVVLHSGITPTNDLKTEIKWFKDDILISGVHTADLVVRETGTYKVVVSYTDIGCERSDEVVVEVYPAISSLLNKPAVIVICKNSFSNPVLNLADTEKQLFVNERREDYNIGYYASLEDAELSSNPLSIPYEMKSNNAMNIYIRLEDKRSGCHEILTQNIVVENGKAPEQRQNIMVCSEYVLPELEPGQFYYSEPKAGGINYQAGQLIDNPGIYTIYVLQDNGGGCFEEISYQLTIEQSVQATVFKDIELECEWYVLEPLSEHNRYFTQPHGQGIELVAGSNISTEQTIYVYASSTDGLCIDESSFTVSYRDCPIPKGISPNGDGLNDNLDLSSHGIENMVIYNRYGMEVYSYSTGYTNQWYGQDKQGNKLPDGTYFYVLTIRGKTSSGWIQINR